MTALAERRLDFKVAVLALDRSCVAASADSPCEGELQAHHVLTQAALRKHGLAEFLWDPANGAAICERHHRRHHNRAEPIPRIRIPHRCILFAIEHDLEWLIDRYYPREDA